MCVFSTVIIDNDLAFVLINNVRGNANFLVLSIGRARLAHGSRASYCILIYLRIASCIMELSKTSKKVVE